MFLRCDRTAEWVTSLPANAEKDGPFMSGHVRFTHKNVAGSLRHLESPLRLNTGGAEAIKKHARLGKEAGGDARQFDGEISRQESDYPVNFGC